MAWTWEGDRHNSPCRRLARAEAVARPSLAVAAYHFRAAKVVGCSALSREVAKSGSEAVKASFLRRPCSGLMA